MRKIDLYRKIGNIRKNNGITRESYPLNVIDIIEETYPNIAVGEMSFTTKGIQGMAVMGDQTNECDVILLNEDRGGFEQNFDCAHELMHILLHRRRDVPSYACFSTVRANQNAYIEWQANEGAAELLVPGVMLIELIQEHRSEFDSWEGILDFKQRTSQRFWVSDQVITTRLESLKYEISQHLAGIPIERLCVLSRTEQKAKGIVVKSLNDIENELMLCSDFGIPSPAITTPSVPQ